MKKIPTFGELMNKQEELVPELKAWLVKESLGLCLKHPMLYDVPYSPQLNALHNMRYRMLTERLTEAKAKEEWVNVVAMHERPWRIWAFMQIEEHLNDKDYWETLGWVWTDSENIWQHFADWLHCLRSKRPEREHFMSPEDAATLASMPESFTIYRGYQKGKNFDGLSYTLEQKRAEWFAKRFERKHSKRATVRERVIHKSEVFAYMDGRTEKEIIVLPFE